MNFTNSILLCLIILVVNLRCTAQNNPMDNNLLTLEQLNKKPYFFSLEEALENSDSVYRLVTLFLRR